MGILVFFVSALFGIGIPILLVVLGVVDANKINISEYTDFSITFAIAFMIAGLVIGSVIESNKVD